MKFKQKEFTEAVASEMFNQMRDEKRRIGLREFAKQTGVSASTLSRIERGGMPDIETFLILCEWMKRGSEEFINR